MRGIYISGDGRIGHAILHLLDDMKAVPSPEQADVVVDFSHPDWTTPLVHKLLEDPRPLVVGTTGLGASLDQAVARLAEQVPVVSAANTSTGVTVLRDLAERAARSLGESWDIEILEMHHRNKVDAPSGTAWSLLESMGNREDSTPSRVGETGPRTDSEIGIQSLRGGDVVGEHTVFLIGPGERIELTHRCWDRDTFARGALLAARWLLEPGREPGLYSMSDVLGL